MKEKFIFLLLSILIFSCKDDDNQLTPPENLFTIDLAKEWLEIYRWESCSSIKSC